MSCFQSELGFTIKVVIVILIRLSVFCKFSPLAVLEVVRGLTTDTG